METETEVKSPATSLENMRVPSGSSDRTNFVLARQKSRSRERRESRLFLVDGQLCWNDDGDFSGSGKRNSSIGLGMFGSSMDLTGIGHSIDSSGGAGSGSDEAISYRIKWCRENISKLKQQPWQMGKKLQMLKASKLFIKQHQGELRQGKQAKDVIAGTTDLFERYWRHFKREFANFLVIITPWEMRIKKIESHFGSVVASYFTFLRWIFWLNLANSLVMVAFVMVPELIDSDPDTTGMRRGPLGMQQPLGPDGKRLPRPEFDPTLGDLWEFEGFLRFSPIFQGYYSNVELSSGGFWRKPIAFLLSAIITYLFCFFCITRKLSQNAKLSRIGTKDDEYTFCWSVFVGWDFMIGNSETAYNKTSSLVMNLKEGILEEKEQTKDRNWRLLLLRIIANVLTIILIGASAYVVTVAVQRAENLPEDPSFLQKMELQVVMSGIQFAFPPLFDVIGNMERYHPRKALSWQLGRILCLDFLNFYTLMFSLFGTVDKKSAELNEVAGNITLLRKNATYYANLLTTTTAIPTTTTSTTTTTTTRPLLVNDTLLNMPTLVSNITEGSNSSMVAINGSSLMTNATIPAGGLNSSTIITSFLLASSTIIPPVTVTNSSTALNNVVSSGPFATSTATNTMDTSTFSTTMAAYTNDLKTQTGPGESTTQVSLEESTQRTTTIAGDDGDDYPDLDQAQKVLASMESRQRAKRRANKLDTYRVSRRIGATRKKKPMKTEKDKRYMLAHQIEQEGDSRTPDEEWSGGHILPIRNPLKELVGGHGSEMDEEDDYDDEPIEGRLKLSQPTKTSNASASRRSRTKGQANGWARGVGGPHSHLEEQLWRSRIGQRTNSQTPLLDDDVNMDLYERVTSQTNLNGYESGGEPTTPAPIIINPLGTDLSVLSTDRISTESVNGMSEEPTQPSQEQYWSPTSQSPLVPPIIIGNRGVPLEVASGDQLASGEISYGANPTTITSTTITTMATSTTTGGSASSTSACSGGVVNGTSQSSCIPLAATTSTPPTTLVTTMLPNGTLVTVSLISKQKIARIGFNASEIEYTDCVEIPEFRHEEILALNASMKEKMQSLCWETGFGQEMVKAVIMDLLMNILPAVISEFLRACFVRYCNRCFFWDLERGFPGYQDFKLAENVLHLVNNQSQVWMGMFFAPGLPAINTVKLAVLMYIRSWAVLTSNIPHETVFKVSKSNNFYYWILLINLLICILPVAYSVTWIRPSWHCGPFGGECRMHLVVTKLVKSMLPPEANSVFKYLTSPGAVIPILIALVLIIYYLASTVSSSKEANKELKAQLKREKEQESAVPEITSTAVVDSSAPATTTTTSAIASLATNTVTPSATGTSTITATLNPKTLVAKETSQASETRPKSLLMPPPI